MSEKSEKIKETIADVYYDKAGYGSVYSTYKEAKAKNKLIKLEDVKDWFERNIERKTHLRGYNSYVSKGPRDEFEVDLFDVNYLGQKEFRYGFLAIDNFTKYMWVIPIASKDGDELIRAMKGIVGNMGQPKKIYSDQEPALVGNKFQEWLVDNKILHITTLTHAPSAERAIRTFKDLMTRRLEAPKNENVPWHGNVRLAVLFQYNQKMEQRTIGMTPYDATEKKNEETVRAMLELNAVQKRKYPDVKVGDYVKVYKKKR